MITFERPGPIPGKLNALAIRRIRRDFDGSNYNDLAALYDVTPGAIRYQVRNLPKKPGPVGRPRSFNYERVAALYRQGFRAGELAERMGVSKVAIYSALHEMGLTKRTARKKFDHAQAVRLVASGLSTKEAAAQLGVTPKSILAAVRKARESQPEMRHAA